LIWTLNEKRVGQPITLKTRPAAGNIVNLIDALRASKPAQKPKRRRLLRKRCCCRSPPYHPDDRTKAAARMAPSRRATT
jgi:hypothetical protein